MKILTLCNFFLICTLSGYPQSTEWNSEIQSSFIDISGLFGLDEFAQVTTIQYRKGRFMVDGFHSFSWNEPGKTIQSFFGAGYVFPFDTTGSKSLTLKNDFAFNRVANNGSFLRPMVVYKWQWQPRHTFYIVSWLFLDTRREPLQPLNGGTIYLANTYSLPFKKITFRDELRILFVTINNLRDVVGAVNQLKISINRNKFYAVSNLGFSFYRSDGLTQWIWNIGIGKSF